MQLQESLQGERFGHVQQRRFNALAHARSTHLKTRTRAATCALHADYICRGPLLAAAGITPETVEEEVGTWQMLGQQLASQLGFDHGALDAVQKWVKWLLCGVCSVAVMAGASGLWAGHV